MGTYLYLLDQLLFVMIMNVNKPEKQDRKERVGFLLSQVGSRSAQEFAKRLEPLGLTPADAGILRMIARSDGMSQQALAKALGMHASRLVLLIDDLEKRELVVRKAHPSDRRLYSLALTPQGEEMLGFLRVVADEHNREVCAALTKAEAGELHLLLSRIADHFGLAAGVHPGYQNLGKGAGAGRGRPKKQ